MKRNYYYLNTAKVSLGLAALTGMPVAENVQAQGKIDFKVEQLPVQGTSLVYLKQQNTAK